MTESAAVVPPATRALADWAARLQYANLPEQVCRQARLSLLDYLGCALLGSTREPAQRLLEVIQQLSTCPQASLIGTDLQTSVTYAALFNGVLGSASFLLEDTAAESLGHPGVNVIPAALAIAEHMNVTGAQLLTAIVVGYEAAMRVGAAAGWRTFNKGWHSRGGFNVFGSAAAAAKLLGLSSCDRFCAAFGLAGTQASGLVEPSSPHDGWLLLSGSGAQDGVLAALLAAHDWTAGCSVIEGSKGYLQAVAATPCPERVIDGLGERFEIQSITRKRHASSSLTHSAIDLVLELKEKYRLSAEMIEAIHIRTVNVHYLRERHWPERRLDGPHSLPYLAAVAFLDGEILDPQFEPQRREDPLVRHLFDRVTVTADDALSAKLPGELPSEVTITLRNGQQISKYKPYPRGDPRDPLTDEEIVAKYRRLGCAVMGADRLEDIRQWVDSADTQPSVRDLMTLLGGGKNAKGKGVP